MVGSRLDGPARSLATTAAITLALHSFLIILHGTLGRLADVEYHCYVNYARSLVSDGDFNILDQAPRGVTWLVSTTFNLPEMHDHGVSVLWAPFFLLGRLLGLPELRVARGFAVPADYLITSSISLFASILALRIFRDWYADFTGRSPDPLALSAILGSTGLVFYTLQQYNGTEAAVLLFATIALAFSTRISDGTRLLDFFCLGAFFAFGRVIKIHALTALLPLAYVWFVRTRTLGPTGRLRQVLAFTAGALPVLAALELNNVLKFGFLNPGQGYLQEFSLESLWRQGAAGITYFGPVGFFSHTPGMLFSFLAFLILLLRWARTPGRTALVDRIAVLAYGSVILKFALLAFVATPGTIEFGSRNFVIDSAAEILVLSRVLASLAPEREPGPAGAIRRAIAFLVLAGILQTTFRYFWYQEVDSYFPDQRLAREVIDYGRVLARAKDFVLRLGGSILDFPASFIANLRALPWLLVPGFALAKLPRISASFVRGGALRWAGVTLLLLYMGATALNMSNNGRNARALQADPRFARVVVGNGPHIFTFDNAMTDLVPTMEADKHRRDRAAYDYKRGVLNRFLSAARSEVIVDPVGFRDAIDRGRIPRIGLTGDDTASSVLDFEGPDRIREPGR